MLLILLALGFWSGQLGAFLPAIGFILIIQNQYIIPEEAFLEDAFGEEYTRYKEQVRRWI